MKTKEQVAWKLYQEGTEYQSATEEIPLGPWTSYSMINDPKHMAFVLARYKFCAKMLEGRKNVVEIGCGDGFGVPIVAQAVGHLHLLDWDLRNIEICKRRLGYLKNVSSQHVDLNLTSIDFQADAAYSIDVIEHIEPSLEKRYMDHVAQFLREESVLITGTPNITASPYALKRSEVQHINLKSMRTLRELTEKYYKHVFMFGMNDEVVHTGYASMCHYIWSVGAQKR